MNRFVVMVDAGYLLRQCVEIASGGKAVSRSQLRITNPSALIALLVERGGAVLGVTQRELLRVYWYDGVQASGRTPQSPGHTRHIATYPEESRRRAAKAGDALPWRRWRPGLGRVSLGRRRQSPYPRDARPRLPTGRQTRRGPPEGENVCSETSSGEGEAIPTKGPREGLV